MKFETLKKLAAEWKKLAENEEKIADKIEGANVMQAHALYAHSIARRECADALLIAATPNPLLPLSLPLFGGDTTLQDADALLHRLWTKAVGTDGYVKDDWKELERRLRELKG